MAGSPNCQTLLSELLRNLASNFARLRSRDPSAGLKHRSTEERIGPATGSPNCQMLLSELPIASNLARLRSRDPFAGLQHHGSEGRIGPLAGSLNCQTLLSELPRNYNSSFKPCFYLPSCTANCQLACVLLQLAFVLHGSGPGTPSQGLNTVAVKNGSSPWPAAPTAKRCFLNRLETISNLACTCPPALPTANLPASSCSWLSCCTVPVKGPLRRAQPPWH